VLTLMLVFLLLLLLICGNLELTFSAENHGGEFDIFTQKEPFSGRGLNVTSDAFGPEEEVMIYASVIYNDYPVAMAHVAFEIHGPENSVYNITFFDYARTDDSGVANISFRIGLVSEIHFGEWRIVGSVYLVDEVLQDFLSFEAGWIVEIISMKTVDENNVEQTKFMKGECVGIELLVRNIAMTEKKATIAITMYDLLNVLVNSTQMEDYALPATSTELHIHCFLAIPEWASAGDAVVSACAYTAPISLGGVPYCPKVSKSFLIVDRDVAILEVKTSPTVVYKGETVNVDVTVENQGYQVESFNLNVYYNKTNLIGVKQVVNLRPDTNVTLGFTWNTSEVNEGFYPISAYAEPVPNEIDISDNTYVDGVVEVRTGPPPLMIHDVAVLTVSSSSTVVYVGEVVEVVFVVGNLGNFTESFDVTAYADLDTAVIGDEIVIGVLTVENLVLNGEKSLVFYWDTLCVVEGCYVLSVLASQVPGEKNVGNNLYVDGVVQVKPSPPLMIHDVAILTVSSSSILVYVGEVVEIFIVVKNQGNFTESFNVTSFYDLHVVETLLVENLGGNSERTLVFRWNTQEVMEGNYTLSASATMVPGEENLKNNSCEDGVVTVVEAPKGWFIPCWFYLLLLLLLILIVVLMIAWLCRRRKRKKAEDAFYSGWTAWYYGYDMRNRALDLESN